MRIALASREFAPFQGWGAGTYASLAAQALSSQGHEVHVITGDARTVKEGPRLRPGVAFHQVEVEHEFPQSMASLPAFASQPQRYAWALWELLGPLHDRLGFDVIEFPDFLGEAYFCIRAKRTLGAFANALLCVRTHMTIRQIRALNHDDWIDQERACVEHMEAWSVAHADAIIPPCDAIWTHVRESMRVRGNGPSPAPPPPHLVMTLPIDVDALRKELGFKDVPPPTPAPAPTPLPAHSPPTIVYCGRYERRKGVHVLVHAAQRMIDAGTTPGLCVQLVGDDTSTGPLGSSYRAWLESLIAPQHRDAFRFVPRMARSELGALYRGATVVCVPSLWENFPFACTEAMALGKCVVGTDVGGIRDIIVDGASGLLARADDVASLASALERALADAPLRDRLGKAATMRVRALCDPATVTRTGVAWLQGLLEAQARHAERTRVDSGTRIVSSASGLGEAPPAISVIVPVYNLHQFLPDTLRSLREQSFQDFETIVVDDGSTDQATIASLDALARTGESARVRVVRIAHEGLSAARNAGISAARGRYVLPLDSDDMLAPRALELFLRAHERNPTAPFVTSPLRSFPDRPDKPVAGWIPLGGDPELLPVMNAASSCVALMERERVLDVGGYDTSLPAYEDWDLYCRLVAKHGEGEVVPEFLVLHRLRGSSMMHSLSRKRHHLLRARLSAKYPHLSPDPGRTARLMLGDAIHLASLDAQQGDHASIEQRARELIQENARYRLADKANRALKRMGIQAAVKKFFT